MNLRSGPIIEMGGDFLLKGVFLFYFIFSIRNLKHLCYETLRYVVACGFSVNPLQMLCCSDKSSYFSLH